jgi:hypothetical protein
MSELYVVKDTLAWLEILYPCGIYPQLGGDPLLRVYEQCGLRIGGTWKVYMHLVLI